MSSQPESDAEPSAPRTFSPPPAVAAEPGGPPNCPGEEDTNCRDCTQELTRCENSRQTVRDNPITAISIDISPPFTLAKLRDQPEEDYTKTLEDTLAHSPSRVFRDHDGDVLAEGRLTDFRNGRVWVTNASGEVVKTPFSDLSEDDKCFVSAWWSIPTECALGDEAYQKRSWVASTMTWKAPAACHKPLYFEEVQLERYGHTAGPFFQPLLSGAHFALNIAALPYKMGIHPPQEGRYPLGYYRPGNCAPWLVPPIPLSIRGGLLAAGVYTGGVYIIP
jgi:hypothetical protein